MSLIQNFQEEIARIDSRFKDGTQEDAAEFFELLIYWMAEEMNCLVSSLLRVRLIPASKASCEDCQSPHPSTNNANGTTIRIVVPDQGSLSVSLQDLVTNHLTSGICIHRQDLFLSRLESSSKGLFIHLLRYNDQGMKVSTPVDLKRFLLLIQSNSEILEYELVSLIGHHGSETGYGHYTACVFGGKELEGERNWFWADDSFIQRFPSFPSIAWKVRDTANCLFFQRRTSN